MNQNYQWSAGHWINEGGSQLATDPALATRIISQGLKLEPRSWVGWFNLGIGLHQRRLISAAVKSYQQALIQPDADKEAVYSNLAQDLLLSGDLIKGWEVYEQRLYKGTYDFKNFEEEAGEAWKGPDDIRECNHLILVAEQGYGDTLQFLRFAILLQQQGYKVTLFCQPQLKALIAEGSELLHVISKISADDFKKDTLWCPLMSLPHRYNLNYSNIPLSEGYLELNQAHVEYWKKKLPRKKGVKRIALHWQGNPDHEGKLYSRRRSIPLKALHPLSCLKNVEFVAIQKGTGLEQITQDINLNFIEQQEIINQSMDFRDTAAVLLHCDLLISSDSGVVHLAGALGIPCWVGLRWIPEWRWGLNGYDTPWYSCLRLFRQQRDNDWQSVITAMLKELQK